MGSLESFKRQLYAWREMRRIYAGDRAALKRLRALLGVDKDVEGLLEEATQTSHALTQLGVAHHDTAIGVREGAAKSERLDSAIHKVRDDLTKLEMRIRGAEHDASIGPVSRWIADAVVDEGPLVSIAVATRNRADLLARAIGSVRRQSYPNWELIVVDDGSDDGTDQILAAVGDPRLRSVRIEHSNASAARNAAIDIARGRFLAFLDDDNTMAPDWLRSIVWGFGIRPNATVLYGARVIEDRRALDTAAPAGLPEVHFPAFDRQSLERANFIDLNAIAIRLPNREARLDEALDRLADWDLVLRLTRDAEPFALPAIACFYTHSAPHRLSDEPGYDEQARRVRAKARNARPLRILSYNALYPLITETYIGEEMEALAANGAEIAYCRQEPAASPVEVPRPVFDDLRTAVDAFRPDALMLHWNTHAQRSISLLEDLGLPFGLRTHSFDFDAEEVARIIEHPLCIGIWGYAHHAREVPGMLTLPSIFNSVGELPEPTWPRDLVLSVSAGLPKRDWDALLESFGRLSGTERSVVIGVTNGFEGLPARIEARFAQLSDPARILTNVPRREVFAMLARTAVLIYALGPNERIGNPMSVIEALCSGASVILPDRPEVQEIAGPAARTYRNADDIVRHTRQILAGGPAIDAEREANKRFGRERYCDPDVPKRFFQELSERVAARYDRTS